MANNYDLLVTIKSDDKNFSKGFRSANNALKKTQHEIKNTGKSYQNLNRAQKQSIQYAKEVYVKYGAASKQFKSAAKNVRRYTSEVNKANMAVSSLSKKSGAGAGLEGSIMGVATRRILPLMAIGAATKGIADGVRTLGQFEKQIKKVGVISDASSKELKLLEQNARAVGAGSVKTASEVAQLQIELSKLGFDPKEIMDASEAITSLSIAFDEELGQTAVVVASTLRAFNMDASETESVANLMSEAFRSSALDLNKFSIMMPKIASLASALNIPISRVTAMLAKLADAGVDSSTAGTSLRNMFLKLKKEGKTLDQALKEMTESTDAASVAMEYFDVRNVNAALILRDTIKETDDLAEALDNTTVSVKDLADEMSDNLVDKTAMLKSAWDELIITVGNTEVFKKAIGGLTDSLVVFSVALGDVEERVAKFDQYLKIMSERSTQYGERFKKGFADGLEMTMFDMNEDPEKELERMQKRLTEQINKWAESGLKSDLEHANWIRGYIEAMKEQIENISDEEDIEIVPSLEVKGKKGGGGGTDEIIGILNTLNAKLKEAKKLRDEAITPQQIAQQDKVIELLKQEIGYYNGLFQAIKKTAKAIPDTLSSTTLAGGGIAIEGLSFYANPELTIDTINMEKSISQFAMDLDALLEDSVGTAISESAQWLGEAIAKSANGVDNAFEGYGQKALQILGDFLVQLGELLIAQGVAIIAVEEAWVSPYLAIAAGAAAVVIGSAISSLGSPDLSGSASSTSTMPNVNVKACEGYSQYSTPLGGGSNGSNDGGGVDDGMVEFVIKGDALVGVLERNKVRNKNFT